MKDQSKTKQELIQELSSLRQKVSEMERLESVFRKAEMRLSAVNECLLSLSNDVGDNIRRLTALAGELMGATASIYNRLEGDMLVAVGQWQTPADFKVKDDAQGHICYDVIRKNEGRIVHIRNLAETNYAETDPNVCAYGLATYIGHVVRYGSEPVGSLCVVFQRDFIPTTDDERFLGILASSLGAEEKRRLNENALQESEEQYRTVLDEMEEGYQEVDLAGNFTFFNEAFLKIFGYSAKEMMGKNYSLYAAKQEIAKKVYRAYNQMYKTGIPLNNFEWDIIRKDGARRTIEFSAFLLRDSNGHPTGFRGIVRDITDRRRVEQALKESEEKYRNILESMSDSYFETDLRGNMTFCNPMLPRSLGYSPEEMAGMNHRMYMDPENAEIVERNLRDVYKGNIPSKVISYEVIRKDRTIVHVESSFSLIKNNDGHPIGYRGISRDITDRKRAEEKLRESEKRHRELTDFLPISIFEIDTAGSIASLNRTALETFGYNEEDYKEGMTALQFFPPEEWQRVGENMSQVIQGTSTPGREYTLLRKDGSRFIGLIYSSAKIHENKTVGIRGAMIDVTERKKADTELRKAYQQLRAADEQMQAQYNSLVESEQSLRESEERYRYLVKHAPTGIYEVDVTARKFLSVNDVMCHYTGYTREEFLAMDSIQLLTEESMKTFMQRHPKVLAGEPFPDNVEYQIKRKDGSAFWALLNSRHSYEPDNRIIATVIAHDITDRKTMEQSLRESEDKYRTILENIDEAYFEIDLKGNMTFCNDSTCSVSGYAQSELMNMNYRQYTSPETEKKLRAIYSNIYKTGEKRSLYDFEVIRKDKHTRNMELSVNLMRNSEGEAIGFRCIARDITVRRQVEEERKMLQERLRRAEKMEALGTLAGGVAHDLNNVLGVLVGYSELLLQSVPQESPFQRHAKQIFKGGQRAAAIIQDLLTLTRRGVLVSEALSLNSVISDFMQMPEFETIKSHHPGVQFKTSLDAELLNIKGSSTHLNKTVMNLLSNAAEAISGSGEVLIRTENRYLDRPIHGYDTTKEGEYAVLTVSDTGSGISQADLGRIFEPFYTKKVMGRSGTGLGLAVVWGTVKDHDGYIDVQSTEGEGSIFTLYFPVTREDLTNAEQVVPQSTYMGLGEHILVVDDV